MTAERQVEIQAYTTRKLCNVVALNGAIDICDRGIGIICTLWAGVIPNLFKVDQRVLVIGIASGVVLGEMRLVGGTSLALQYGHRRSIDLDFFGDTTEDVEELTEVIHLCANQVVRGNCTKKIKAFFLDGVKVDVVNYRYRWIDAPVIDENLRLASPKDIAAMKVNAVMGRGTKKDFVDMYFLLKHYSFDEIMQFYLQKYTDGSEYS